MSVVGDGPVGRLLRPALASLPVRCFTRFSAIGGRNRALVLAGQAFIAFIPLLILVSVVASSSAEGALPEQMVTRFHLSGDAADAMRTLFARPPDSEGALTVISAVVLLASLLSFARALQGTYEAAWALAPRGVRGTLTGLVGIALLLSQILLLSLLVSLLSSGLGARVGSTVLRAVVGIPFWLALQFILLSGRVPWRVLLPGAVVMGIGQSLISLGSAVWMPHLVSTNAARYGTIGVTFALLSWLILVCAAIVAGAAVSMEMSDHQRRPCGPPTSPPTPRTATSAAPATAPRGAAPTGCPPTPPDRPPATCPDTETAAVAPAAAASAAPTTAPSTPRHARPRDLLGHRYTSGYDTPRLITHCETRPKRWPAGRLRSSVG